ncbi:MULTISPECIES: hypothetical protein [unclassified Variovorax]|uniref:hypothetical protein n=1 Tax=unclassified Variovorax TaxID=663243 RepID=UPI0008385EB2|nr:MULTISPECIES: hypothetical protein [unclassified Variovorax]PNG46390.1 hypothetical protein CHC06_06731 [Variovorax sp. B2]PNG47788.1 hypothetical protein CHC07_06956 [Variovorax sp. B4]VTV14125.1 hypothetical protein WDL1CHR_04704 [Variovorax sp. WDL1]
MAATLNHSTLATAEDRIEAVFEVQSLLRSIVAGLDRTDAEQPEIDAARLARMAESRLEGLAASLDAA